MSNLALRRLDPFAVGFDKLFDDIETLTTKKQNSYPPYNIIKSGEDSYAVELAVAGFTRDDIEITSEKDKLTVRGNVPKEEIEVNYLHRGLARRAFERTFKLAENVEVVDATLEHGMLYIDLKHFVPEEQKPKLIKIK
jgi:molecular chaperone IbpA